MFEWKSIQKESFFFFFNIFIVEQFSNIDPNTLPVSFPPTSPSAIWRYLKITHGSSWQSADYLSYPRWVLIKKNYHSPPVYGTRGCRRSRAGEAESFAYWGSSRSITKQVWTLRVAGHQFCLNAGLMNLKRRGPGQVRDNDWSSFLIITASKRIRFECPKLKHFLPGEKGQMRVPIQSKILFGWMERWFWI